MPAGQPARAAPVAAAAATLARPQRWLAKQGWAKTSPLPAGCGAARCARLPPPAGRCEQTGQQIGAARVQWASCSVRLVPAHRQPSRAPSQPTAVHLTPATHLRRPHVCPIVCGGCLREGVRRANQRVGGQRPQLLWRQVAVHRRVVCRAPEQWHGPTDSAGLKGRSAGILGLPALLWMRGPGRSGRYSRRDAAVV